MKWLPDGWDIASIPDLIAPDGLFSDGDWVESKDQDPTGEVRLLQLADIGDGIFLDKSKRYINDEQFERLRCTEVLKGDVLIARMPDPLGRTCLAPLLNNRCITVVDVAIVRPGKNSSETKWMMHFLNAPSVRQKIDLLSSGTTRRRISRGKLAELQLPIPPFNEQKRIANKLDTVLVKVDACREHIDRIPAIIKRFRQSVLAAATSGKLTEDWRKNKINVNSIELVEKIHAAHRAAGGHKIGNAAPPTEDVHDLSVSIFPVGWNLLTLRDLVRPDRPITYGILKPGPEIEDGVRYIRVADFPADKINHNNIRMTSHEIDQKFKRSKLKQGDLLLSIRGTVGRIVKIPLELEEANITQDSARLSIQPLVNCDFVLCFLRSELAQSRMRGAIKGVAVRGINIGDVRALQVPLPPKEEQDEIVQRVEILFAYADRFEVRYNAARNQVDRLTPSLLAKAFSGELVPQDPNDEPASVLLERIRAARAAEPVKTRSRKMAGRAKKIQKSEVIMLQRNEIKETHLTTILKERGPLTAEALWSASQLDIDDFYDQLKVEEEQGCLQEQRSDALDAPRLLEAAA